MTDGPLTASATSSKFRARAVYTAIQVTYAAAKARRANAAYEAAIAATASIQSRMDEVTTELLRIAPPQGNA
jgi:hypothetical protein